MVRDLVDIDIANDFEDFLVKLGTFLADLGGDTDTLNDEFFGDGAENVEK